MKVLVLDNYDSFTYNLVHMLRELNVDLEVFRNDEISLEEVNRFDKILLSPGPGLPSEAGIMPALLKKYSPIKSVLGVCLGHQAIGECFGGSLYNLPRVFHGIASDIEVLESDHLYAGLPGTFRVCRYHSWVIAEENLPSDLIITSRDVSGTIMSIRHKTYDVQGVQYHPESIMTEHGMTLIKNWIEK
jgi:anthranilate synthase component 2